MIRYTCIACLVFCNNINVAYLIKTDRLKLCIETIAVFCQVLRLSATRTIPPVLQSYRHPTCWPFPPPEPFHRWSSLITILHSALFRRQNHSTSHPVLSPPYMLAFSTARTIPPVLQSYRHPTCWPFPPPEPFHRCSSLIATLHAALFRRQNHSTGAPVLSPPYMLPFSARISSHTSFSTTVRPQTDNLWHCDTPDSHFQRHLLTLQIITEERVIIPLCRARQSEKYGAGKWRQQTVRNSS